MILYFLLVFGVGVGVGAALFYWRSKVSQRERRRIPKEWPLTVRPLVNSREQRVWVWLSKVMFDQQILIKLPVTRFTSPAVKEQASHWYQMLNGVYCTFTVCDTYGNVIGCVDVAGNHGLSMGNQTLKHSLLSQCNMRYWVVDPDNLPQLAQIRSAFLGDRAVKGSGREDLESRFKDVSENLHAAVTRRRKGKIHTAANHGIAVSSEPGFAESRLASGWEDNSFLSPLDSRSADL